MQEAIVDLRRCALESEVAPSSILNQVKEKFSVDVLQALPCDANLSRSIRLQRQPLGMKQAKCREDIELKDSQKMDLDGETRFLFKDFEDEKRILIFATDRNIQVMSYVTSTPYMFLIAITSRNFLCAIFGQLTGHLT